MSADATLSTLGEAALDLVRRGFAVIPLKRRAKVPLTEHGCKDWTHDEAQVMQWWTRWPEANIGIVCGAPSGDLLVIDLDCHEDDAIGMDTLNAWTREHGELPETVSAVTGSGGYHLFYRMPNAPVDVNRETGVDLRGDGGYVVAAPSVHGSGNAYEWETPPSECEVAEADDNVRAFVQSVQKERGEGGRYILPDTFSQHERNNGLFHAGCSERSRGMDDDRLTAYLIGINQLRCDPPLEVDEVKKIARSICEHYEPGHSAEFDAAHPAASVHTAEEAEPEGRLTLKEYGALDGKNNALLPYRFADYLIDYYHACHINEYNDDLAIWDGAAYQTDVMIPRVITKIYEKLNISNEREVLHSLFNKAPVMPEATPEYIGFINGVLNIDTGEFVPPTPELLIVNTIPHRYNAEVDTTAMDDVLNDYACGDSVIVKNLAEIIGACMWRSTEYAQCAILVGRGANGKSTYMNMLKAVLGKRNFTTIDISLLGERFQTTHLKRRLADFADDTASDFLKRTTLADFKKAITGEGVSGERKNVQEMDEFEPYATFIISANEMPCFAETTEGMERRLHAVPFNATFTIGNGKQDARIKRRLTSEDACEQLIQIGLRGLASLRTQGQFTPSAASAELVHEMMMNSNSVLRWIDNQQINAEYFVAQETSEMWRMYMSWCATHGVDKPKQNSAFTYTVLQKMPELETRRSGSKTLFQYPRAAKEGDETCEAD